MRIGAVLSCVAAAVTVAGVHAADPVAPPGKVMFGAAGDTVAPAKLGDLTQDLVYTPVAPCRIVDTRATGAGPIAANTTRSFVALNAANYTSQGGSATNCGTIGVNATVVMLVATAVTPIAPGFATVYTFGAAQPAAASMQFAAGAIAVNSLAVQVPNPPSSSGFTVYTTAQSDFVFDIVGYFAPPLATALDCATVSGTAASVPANTYGYGFGVSCPAGYASVSAGFQAAQKVVMADGFIGATSGNFFVYNLDTSAQVVTPWVRCCRVPGR